LGEIVFIALMYTGITKRFQNESITKYMLTSITDFCWCSLQSSPLVSLHNTFSISATDGSTNATAFLESCRGQSAIAPKFQGHCGNNAPIPVISFLKTRRGQIRQFRRLGNYKHVFSSQELLLLLLVGK
jgi:hypothetical protein